MGKQRVGVGTRGSGAGRVRFKVGLMAGAFLLAGIALLGGSLGFRWHVSSEADRLQSAGVPTTATISDRSGGGGRGSGIDRIEINYLFDGVQYEKWIPCAGLTGCHSTPGPQVTIRVDPADPERFVAENGHTNGSLSFLMSWTLIPIGLVLTVIGAGLLFVVLKDKDSWA